MDALMLLGESSRVKDKPFIDFSGKPLFLHGWGVLSNVFDRVLVSCVPRVEARLKKFSVPYVVDEEVAGPVSGMLAGFRKLSSEYVFVAACDMPFLSEPVLEFMEKRVMLDGLVPRHPDGFLEPLHAFYAREKTIKLIEAGGNKSPRQLIEKFNMVYLDTEIIKEFDPQLKCFANANTREELEKLRK